jgi:diaminohydroxyphosphoribosylaminopyrimidine deaminase/5-amino-6-(5-phosphoribosylamino)uracil reductase
MSSGESKWITSEQSRNDVQKLRCNNQAIMTGSGTVIKDNPSLTVKLNDPKISPLRVVIDGGDKITNQKLNIFSSDASTLVLNSNNSSILSNGKIDLKAVLIKLGEMGINNLLVEAGSGLNGAMLEAGLIDEYIIYTAPIILGNDAQSMFQVPLTKMAEKISLDIIEIRNIGDDIKIKAIPR